MTLEEDIDEMARNAVNDHAPPDDLDVFYRRLRSFLGYVKAADGGGSVTVDELIASLPAWSAEVEQWPG